MRGSNYKAITGKILVFWINSHLREAVAYKRLSHMEVRLYFETVMVCYYLVSSVAPNR